MIKFAFAAAVLSGAVTATQSSPDEFAEIATLESETSLFDFEPVDFQLVKGVSNKRTYTYVFTPGTTLSGSYFYDFIVRYSWGLGSDKKDIGAIVGH